MARWLCVGSAVDREATDASCMGGPPVRGNIITDVACVCRLPDTSVVALFTMPVYFLSWAALERSGCRLDGHRAGAASHGIDPNGRLSDGFRSSANGQTPSIHLQELAPRYHCGRGALRCPRLQKLSLPQMTMLARESHDRFHVLVRERLVA